jgi:hypothetical protein
MEFADKIVVIHVFNIRVVLIKEGEICINDYLAFNINAKN